MHARTALRRRLWIGGSAAATVAATALSPFAGAAIGATAAFVLIGNAMRPSSDFYLRSLRRGPASSRGVALTFDDGPDPERTPQVLDALAEFDARATFFMIGRRAAAEPALVRRVIERGHEIGAHSQTHERTLPFRSRARQEEELSACAASLATAGAPPPRWYRPPMGYATPALTEALAGSSMQSVNWSLHVRDLADPDAERIASRVLAGVRGGDIVLLHDGSDRYGAGPAGVPAALRRILPVLRERGLTTMTVSELLGSAS